MTLAKFLIGLLAIGLALGIGVTVRATAAGCFRRNASRAGGFHGRAERGGFHR